jgi:hypothetical protein
VFRTRVSDATSAGVSHRVVDVMETVSFHHQAPIVDVSQHRPQTDSLQVIELEDFDNRRKRRRTGNLFLAL